MAVPSGLGSRRLRGFSGGRLLRTRASALAQSGYAVQIHQLEIKQADILAHTDNLPSLSDLAHIRKIDIGLTAPRPSKGFALFAKARTTLRFSLIIFS
ncbi:hypothetical protein DOO74_12800 [Rhodobacteraceae bacterium AsT-22]|nr:hypothetical protein DOO74_12800 [Rhodobacteraceae bacterium AsT-22]